MMNLKKQKSSRYCSPFVFAQEMTRNACSILTGYGFRTELRWERFAISGNAKLRVVKASRFCSTSQNFVEFSQILEDKIWLNRRVWYILPPGFAAEYQYGGNPGFSEGDVGIETVTDHCQLTRR